MNRPQTIDGCYAEIERLERVTDSRLEEIERLNAKVRDVEQQRTEARENLAEQQSKSWASEDPTTRYPYIVQEASGQCWGPFSTNEAAAAWAEARGIDSCSFEDVMPPGGEWVPVPEQSKPLHGITDAERIDYLERRAWEPKGSTIALAIFPFTREAGEDKGRFVSLADLDEYADDRLEEFAEGTTLREAIDTAIKQGSLQDSAERKS